MQPTTRRSRWYKFAALLLALAAIGGTAWWWWQARLADAAPKYRLTKVERGPLSAVVVASGTLNAVTTVQVGSQVSGQIKEILADFNTAVKKNQIIARIDPSSFELRVNQARADVDSAQSAVAVARVAAQNVGQVEALQPSGDAMIMTGAFLDHDRNAALFGLTAVQTSDADDQAEALTKEPDQRREPSSQQAPALNNGAAPAQFDQHLRHPEQLFHQPAPPSQTTDVPSGRASETAPMGQQNGQGFHPEMAQNGGAFLGNSVFAYDGMEPTAFTSF
jgi:multidrug efflux pump subunit AcrA (membrane-fusion protein)